MNRIFTILFAASCLTAVGQVDDSVGANSNWQLLLEFNGHEYWVLSEPLEWEPARDLCDSLGAYLYWPNDEVEHQAVWDLLPHGDDGVQFWTAIHQDFAVVECGTLNGGWVGPTGEIQTFLPWYPNEPNNSSAGRESVVQFEWGGIGSQFNDAPGQNECDQGSTCECRFAHVILERETPSYCTDPSACNYGSTPTIIAECYYTCCPGPGCCHQGTIWDTVLQQCVVANPSDSNFDGCVQLGDLLDLLSAYGDCAAEELAWQCGDPLEYQGYDYETVQIGEQCWFAENLRVENYLNGDAIPGGLSTSEWLATTTGAKAVYGEVADGEDDWGCETYSPDIDACDPAQSLNEYGRLYNWFTVDDARGLCPSGWHVPTDGEWTVMTDLLGGQSIAGGPMKTDYGWHEVGNGNNLSGFSGLPGGYRFPTAHYYYAGSLGFWWSSSPIGPDAWCRELNHGSYIVHRYYANLNQGYSVRCIKD